MPNKTAYYIGLMSGTSIDAIDAALIALSDDHLELIATHTTAIPPPLKTQLFNLNFAQHNDLHLMAELDYQLGHLFADAVLALLKQQQFAAENISAIGCHGQTIRHQPNHHFPYTLQIGNPHIVAAKTGITVVSDFRRRDLAVGGQGAPLVPAFHRFLNRNKKNDVAFVNIGGIANITYLPIQTDYVLGFDSGPGNTLMDQWCQQHLPQAYDQDGKWAGSAEADETLLKLFLGDPYFKLPPPKSTGVDYFNLAWLNNFLQRCSQTLAPATVQATLLELTAVSIAQALTTVASEIHNLYLYVCGGGAYNKRLLQRLQHHLKNVTVTTTDDLGIAPQWVEAACFAWLAHQTLTQQPANVPSVTGAKRPVILGAVYPKC